MKKVKQTSTQRCSYCKERAVVRTNGMSLVKYACASHKNIVESLDKEHNDAGYMTEGDYQSWGRFYG